MHKDIRKISIGVGFPNKAMHYQLNSEVRFKEDVYKIHSIIANNETGKTVYDIYISDEYAKLLWKTVSGEMPIVVEYNIDFE